MLVVVGEKDVSMDGRLFRGVGRCSGQEPTKGVNYGRLSH
jgi:hypothetical protein